MVNKRILTCVLVIGALILASALIFVGCEEASPPASPASVTDSQALTAEDKTPPAQSATISNVRVLTATSIEFTVTNPNEEAVRVTVSIAPAPPDTARIVVDGAEKVIAEAAIALTASGTDGATKENIQIKELTSGVEYTITLATADSSGNTHSEPATQTVTPVSPGAPTNLVATGRDDEVMLRWDAPTSGPAVSEYRIYRATGADISSATRLTTEPAVIPATTTTYTDQSAENGTQYTYAIRAFTEQDEESTNSATATATPLAAPDAPTGLTATPRNGAVTLNWTAPADGVAVTQYYIYRAEGNSIGGATRPSDSVSTTITETNYIDSSAANGTEYTYAVRAVNANGTESEDSNTDTATPRALAGAPASLMASGAVESVSLTWAEPTDGGTVTGYRIYRAIGDGAFALLPTAPPTLAATTRNYTDNTAVNDITYRYVVRAVNQNDVGGPDSEIAIATPRALAGMPDSLMARAAVMNVSLTWTEPASGGTVDGYRIYRAEGGGTFTLLTTAPPTLTATTRNYTDTTAVNDITYRYVVRAVNQNDVGGPDSETATATPLAAPNAPTGLTATSGNGAVPLSWTAPADGTAVTQYYIYRAEGNSISGAARLMPTDPVTNVPVTITTTTYTDQSAENGTEYTYAVRAVNANGTESATTSNTDTVTPRALSGAPDSLMASGAVGNVTLMWAEPTSGNTVSSYRIYRAEGTSGGSFERLTTNPATLTATTRTYTDNSVTDGTTYRYVVRAVNESGVESDDSETATATPLAAPDAPTNLTAAHGDDAVTLSWTAPATGTDVVQYYIYRAAGDSITGATRLSPTAPPMIDGTTYTDRSAVNGTEYTYAVRAVNANGTESTTTSNTDTVTPRAPAGMPASLMASGAVGNVSLTWTEPASGGTVDGYRIYRAEGGGTFVLLATAPPTLTATTRNYTDTSVTNGTTYRYVVRAVNSYDDESDDSDPATATPLTAPAAPRNLAAAPGADRSLNLTWTAPEPDTSTNVAQYYIYRATGTDISSATRLSTAEMITNPAYTDSGLVNGTEYTYVVTAVNSNGAEGTRSGTASGTPLSAPSNLRAVDNDAQVMLSWDAASDATEYYILRAVGGGSESRLATLAATTYIDRDVTVGVTYHYRIQAVFSGTEGRLSGRQSITPSVDFDGDMLIEIRNLDMLNHIRYDLSGERYRTSAGASGVRCGADGTTNCAGYELVRDLDFADASDYASGTINTAWRPTGGTPGSATNSGWVPLGTGDAAPFAARFEGNGYTISNLYSRNTANTDNSRVGLFGQLSNSGTLRNLLIADSNVYGGTARDHVGIAVGINYGVISNVAVRGGSVYGGDGRDEVGGLAGWSNDAIIASSASTSVYGDDGTDDNVGGLVGRINSGHVTASYATGAASGGNGNDDHVGGLVGRSNGTIRASYATGNVNANAGDDEEAGGLVGLQDGSATIIASYATGNVDGGAGTGDSVGRLSGNTAGTVTASYAFGATSGDESVGNGGSTLPTGASGIVQLTAPGTTSPPNTAVPAQWNQASSHSMGAWNFGSATELPTLRYADYDGGSGTNYCSLFSNIPGTDMAITCGTTSLPGQSTMQSVQPFDLTVSATVDMNPAVTGTSITLTAIVHNRLFALPSVATTLTYYRSADNVVSTGADTVLGTDSIPIITSGATDTQNIDTTVPGTAGDYYYYACVTTQTGEADATNNCSSVITVEADLPIDGDNDRLIDIQNLDMLNNIRHNLAGTSYKTSAGDAGVQCGTGNTVACIGYELMRDLDFAVGSSYDSGSINAAWRSGSGWSPIGTSDAASFATRFEGNGHKISNLYSRNTAHTNNSRFGLFGQVRSNGTLRNLLIEDANVYGGNNRDHVGIAVGINYGIISNVAVRGGSARGGNGTDDVGGLAGWSNNAIIASSASTSVYGDNGADDKVGGLVGFVNGGHVTASYATGAVSGGADNADRVGGLVGENNGTIRASYALGNVSTNAGIYDAAGGLVGRNRNGTVIASYATGNIDGGGGFQAIGRLVGDLVVPGRGGEDGVGTIIESYASGTISNSTGTSGHHGSILPNGVTVFNQLTAPGTTSPPNTAAPAQWQDASSHTMGAWDFGVAGQSPTLRYADYDGSGSTNYCGLFSNVPGTTTAITCGTTLLSGQADLRALPPFDLTVSANVNTNPVIPGASTTLTATVRNRVAADPSIATTLTYYRSTDNTISIATDDAIGTDTLSVISSGATDTQTITITLPGSTGNYYYYACVATQTGEANANNNCSSVITVQVISPIDSDGDRLIDIQNLDMLDHIRYNLAGTSYKTSAGGSEIQCGTDGTTACIGYELMTDLDFAVASDYFSGSINTDWRPTGNATNGGWVPIGDNTTPFATRFEGNGNSISNLYSRNAANTADSRYGLFGQMNASGTLRNLLIADSNVYGGSGRDHVGIAVGINYGAISNVAVRGGSAHGGDGTDEVGGVAGWSNGTIVASSSTADAYGDDGASDNVGSLVGQVTSAGSVTASYATGAVDGGAGRENHIGGLVGNNHGTVRASYARGNVVGGDGTSEAVGGLVGLQNGSATIVASYATGNVDGGAGFNNVGRLTGNSAGTITASYAIGTTSGVGSPGHNGSTLPGGVTTIGQLTIPVAANPPTTAAPAEWNSATAHTMGAWDFGTATQFPVLRYADYDGSGTGTDYCASFGNIPGTATAITCGTTLLSGQGTLRAVPDFDLTVSATANTNLVLPDASITLTAIVSNRALAPPSTATTLTYYRSTDNVVSTGADTVLGTDNIPILSGGASDTQGVATTVPGTAGTYYYYACVTTQTGEADATNNCSSVITVQAVSIDSDGDRLIEIQNLDMLNNIRHNLAGTSYKTSAGDAGIQCGTNGTTACTGYELMRDLDFAVASDYAIGSVNMAWRPTSGGGVVAPASATNSGWQPIGTNNSARFSTLFEGNGHKISNLYIRNTTNTTDPLGLFGQSGHYSTPTITIRNLLIENGFVHGGTARDHVGMAVGINYGIISNVAVRGGSVHGSDSNDEVGGLAGWSNTVIASSSTAAVYGDDGDEDNVGGLVGQVVTGGTVTASYATGAASGGNGNEDHVGGLVGNNNGTIRASYARGNADANNGHSEAAGGLVGLQDGSATIIASYATGDVYGGAGSNDNVGKLTGNTAGTVTASYAFGTTDGETAGNDGDTLPNGVTTIGQLTIPVAANPPTTAAPAAWNQTASHTMNAWNFGTAAQYPILRYADYDGSSSGTDYCASFNNIPGTSTAITCGTTLLSGQATLRSLPAFDLTVSANVNTNPAITGASITLTATVSNRAFAAPSIATTLTYYRSTDNVVSTGADTNIGTDTIPIISSGAEDTQNIATNAPGTAGNYYYYACVTTQTGEANATNNCSSVLTVQVVAPVDSDGDRLIDIQNLDMLNHIRHNLAGTSYKTSAGDAGIQCGTNGTTACIGYELMRDLDFAVASDYASGSVNMAWRPTSGGSVVAPASATNSGWQPIGTGDSARFGALFEGNGNSISNLYSRNTANTADSRFGLFGQIGHWSAPNTTIRNLLIEDSFVHGGNARDHIGMVVGLSYGTISNVAVRGSSVHASGGTDDVGGLAGWSNGAIIASSSTAVVYGDNGADDNVGGLVGRVNDGSVTASYATGAVNGGNDNDDHVGGLVGRNHGIIRASYARGNVNADAGIQEAAGGLVGLQDASATIIASYATGNVSGGSGSHDNVGKLTGNASSGTITASYAFGTLSDNEFAGYDGDTLPSGVGSIGQLTVPGGGATTAAPAEWNQTASHTMNAWNFGTVVQYPILRYADYDGSSSGTAYCASFNNIPGTSTAITCGTTLLSGQATLRAVPAFDLTVSASVDKNLVVPNTEITLTATVSNRAFAAPSTATTLTYYRSTDNVVSTGADTVLGTDSIPVISSGAENTQTMDITLPGTAGNYYYYACVATQTGEADANNNCSSVVTVQVIAPIDSDNDRLIDIQNLDMLNHIRHNLAGTDYKTSAGDTGVQCGTNSDTACIGYELMRDLDFAVAGDYFSGSVNMDWRPTSGSSVVAPASATNSGWVPIGDGASAATEFATLFEGNGNSISNLYSRNTANTADSRFGLFGHMRSGSTLRNLLIEDSFVHGGTARDHIGIAVGINYGTISNVAVRSSSVHASGGTDEVGGLAGWSNGAIIASSSTAIVYGDDGDEDNVGGLVGRLNGGGHITASYATGSTTGGNGNEDHVGGLVGSNHGTIRASYARGNADANNGYSEAAGGLVGLQNTGATIIASYATGDVYGGAGTNDSVGKLSANTAGTITASYGFGTTDGENVGNDGDTLPSGVHSIGQLTLPGGGATTAASAEWNQATAHTMGAWDFGTAAQYPALRYADYDGSSGTAYCSLFSTIPGTTTAITCGTTLLSGQDTLRALPGFDLTLSASVDKNTVVPNTEITFTATVSNRAFAAPSTATTLTYYRSVDNVVSTGADTNIGTDSIPVVSSGAENTQTMDVTLPGTAGNYYYYACVTTQSGEADATNNCSSVLTVQVIAPIDSDNDMLIDIQNLDMLNHIRYNLSGTDYKTSAGDTGVQCGTNSDTACIGYELLRDLDFADAGDYASGSINMAWRPTSSGSVVAPASATNSGWQPIATGDTVRFSALFEGNGNSISNLYSRNAANTGDSRFGLFGELNNNGVLRNLLIENGFVHGGTARDHVGIAVGLNRGTISNVAVRGGSVHGSDGSDEIGGLAGWSENSIVASSSTAAVYGDDGTDDNAGGLVGRVNNGSVTASYATGAVDGGGDNDDHVGGLVGLNNSAIRASYARGNVNANDGVNEAAGGLVGLQSARATIVASYATGNVDGGGGANDSVGKLTGNASSGTITASYGFGGTNNGENAGNDGDTLPSGITSIGQLTIPDASASPPATAAPAAWQDAASHTMNAWDFGTATQYPVLRYADYDGSSGTNYCSLFSTILGSSTEIVCGTTLLSGQADLRALAPFDLTLSANVAPNPAVPNSSVTLTAVLRNRNSLARPSIATTLTYYRSTDNVVSTATDTAIGTDAIPVIHGGGTSTQDMAITVPGTTGSYYYYACVASQSGERFVTNNCSSVITVQVVMPIDSDNDRLIDIQNLDMLNHIRYNLNGTSYKTSAGDSGLQCGTNNTTACIGYELMRDLDFAVAGDYASGSVNMTWRPTSGGSVVAPASATNSGWVPIGNSTTPFRARLEGNGNTISNLYSRNTANTADSRFGFVGQMWSGGTLQNLLFEDGNVYGGNNRDHVGIVIGVHLSGIISNVAVRGGSVDGGGGNDEVGGLAGWSNGAIISTSSSAAVQGNWGNDDNAGGLVGRVNGGGSVTASYATGTVNGGGGGDDHVGGLVGRNHGIIRASYARGNVDASGGSNDAAGGLVGLQDASATIIASYATGNANGGPSAGDHAGKLTGNASSGTITASYAFGTTDGENAGYDGSALPGGVGSIGQLTIPDASASPPATAAPAEWQDASSQTMNAWDFGTAAQYPALRYADYDGSSGTNYCSLFSNIPGTTTAITCDTTLLSGQDTLRTLPSFDLTVSANVNTNPAVTGTSITLTATVSNRAFAAPSTATTLTYYRSTDNVVSTGADTNIGTDTIPVISSGAEDTQTLAITLPGTVGNYYYYACVTTQTGEANANNNCSSVITVQAISPIDTDNDRLIDIQNLDMLDHIRHNLAGTSYKTSAGDTGVQCGTNSDTACIGYELSRDLDFAVAGDYASGTVNMAWRPTSGGSVVAPASATNSGWVPIGDNTNPFATLFEGNGNSISNLYIRNTANTADSRTGLFGQIRSRSTLRNLLIENGFVHGGTARDHIGVAVGVHFGVISNVAVRGGSVHGSGGNDDIGGLAGWSNDAIIASSSTAAVWGDDGVGDNVGGLVGRVNGGHVTASYATGAATGGNGNEDHVGGLVGRNHGIIRASYARGNVNANDGASEAAGGLVGLQDGSATIIASYATGNVDGGAGANDSAGQLSGNTAGTITASYASGTVSGGENSGNNGSALPNGAGSIGQLTIPVAVSPPATAAPAEWNSATNHTMGAWDFGTVEQFPALRYADYDGSTGTNYCSLFSNIPGTTTAITCGATLLSGQNTLRALAPFDLTVSATVDANRVLQRATVTLTATVRNRSSALPSTAGATLTYYRSTDNVRNTVTDPAVGTDSIPVVHSGTTSTQNIAVTVPGTTGNHYYYACVTTQTGEADATNNCSSVITITVIPDVDTDRDRLIEIQNLDMLDHIRYNLSGTSYKTSGGDSGMQCGANGTTACIGYELMRDLDFASGGSYASGSVNSAWRSGSGWSPIGNNGAPFGTLLEGNGYRIRNLHSANTGNANDSRYGLFGQLNGSGTIRNLLVENGNVHGGNNRDHVGVVVGVNLGGTIVNVTVRGGSARGNGGADEVGGLAGYSSGTIIASSSSAAADAGDNSDDNVGGLVGQLAGGGTIIASYATGAADGGTGARDRAGGLVGRSAGAIIASFSTGAARGNFGQEDHIGGLVGQIVGGGTVTASYATGVADGGPNRDDRAGSLAGHNGGTITASYGFGNRSGEHGGHNGSTRPSGVTNAAQLTAPGSASRAAPVQWNQAASRTLNAWDFGTNSQNPALRYADYDGAGGTDYCALFTNVPGASTTAITCGTTLLPNQR